MQDFLVGLVNAQFRDVLDRNLASKLEVDGCG